MLTMLTMLRRATKGPDSPCLQKLNPTQELPFHLGAHTVDRMGKQSHKILPENSCLSWVYSPHQCWWTIPLLSQRKISEMIFADGMLCQSRLFTTSYSFLAIIHLSHLCYPADDNQGRLEYMRISDFRSLGMVPKLQPEKQRIYNRCDTVKTKQCVIFF